MHIESPSQVIHKSREEVFEFLCQPANYEKLMPENIEKFRVLDEETFLFALKGMPEIALRKKDTLPPQTVVLGAASGKLPFTLRADIRELAEKESEVTLTFEGEFNAMMAMMVKSPITNFMNTLATKLGTI